MSFLGMGGAGVQPQVSFSFCGVEWWLVAWGIGKRWAKDIPDSCGVMIILKNQPRSNKSC